ncbi:hypothetical protein Trydic_g2842 [Trypoxylus dichotomus]
MDEPKRVKLDMYPNLPQGIFQYMIGCVRTSTNSTTHAKTVFKMFCPLQDVGGLLFMNSPEMVSQLATPMHLHVWYLQDYL